MDKPTKASSTRITNTTSFECIFFEKRFSVEIRLSLIVLFIMFLKYKFKKSKKLSKISPPMAFADTVLRNHRPVHLLLQSDLPLHTAYLNHLRRHPLHIPNQPLR